MEKKIIGIMIVLVMVIIMNIMVLVVGKKNNAKMESALKCMEDAQKWEQQIQYQKNQQRKLSSLLDSNKTNILPPLFSAQNLAKLVPHIGSSAAASAAFNNSPMAIKYYDNDGFFYEMGSVDGWRRRQPGSTPPNSTSPFQTKRVGSAMSTQHYDQQTPRRKPLQYQAYQQPAPHLGGFDLQDVAAAVLAHQQQQQSNNHHQSTNNSHHCCGASPAVACYCTLTAAIAAQLVLQKQQQMMSNKRDNNKMKCSDIHSLIDDSTTKGLDFGELNTTAALKRLAGNISQPISLGTNWQVPPHSRWNSPINEEKTSSVTTTTTGSGGNGLVVGSFEEPYEFYWSGDETSGGIGNNNNTSTGGITTHTAASISSVDDDPIDELGIEANAILLQKRPSIAPIGSEAFAAQEAKRASLGCVVTTFGTTKCNNNTTNIVSKRPDSLRLAKPKAIPSAYESISPGEIIRKNNNFESSQRDFDVDKFIADLPMPLDHERLLNSLRNPQRTPIGPTLTMPHNNNNNEPITADSPLFTPILPGKNPWSSTYRPSHANPWAYP
jgi:hypothetical protein